MREATKMFNLLLSYRQYQTLRKLSLDTNVSIAELVRRGVDSVLKNEKFKKPESSGGQV